MTQENIPKISVIDKYLISFLMGAVMASAIWYYHDTMIMQHAIKLKCLHYQGEKFILSKEE